MLSSTSGALPSFSPTRAALFLALKIHKVAYDR